MEVNKIYSERVLEIKRDQSIQINITGTLDLDYDFSQRIIYQR